MKRSLNHHYKRAPTIGPSIVPKPPITTMKMIGAVLYWWFKDRFIDHDTWYSTSIGVIALVVALALQRGIWGLVRDRFGIYLFPIRRRLEVDDVAP